MDKKIESIKHGDTRVHIPSNEEAGYERQSPKVSKGKQELQLPKNPVVHRGQDPELFWLDKYGPDDTEERINIDIRSLYRHEHIAPEKLIEGLYKVTEEKRDPSQQDLFSVNELFGNALELDELEKVSEYYSHSDGWTNRLIQGDSLLVMSSLLEREGMAGQVQTIYIDPPYGIKYNSNWQMRLNDRNVKDGSDEHLSGEPEMIKAFRDTWELGIHSYLSYLRDRLLVAKELLTESGSCFVQISDENVHLVRCLMDEVFGSENFVSQIMFTKAPGGLHSSRRMATRIDYLLWYSKNLSNLKKRSIFIKQIDPIGSGFNLLELSDGKVRSLTSEEKTNTALIPENSELCMSVSFTKPGPGSKYIIELDGIKYDSGKRWWGSPKDSILKLHSIGRTIKSKKSLRYKAKFSDFPYSEIDNLWTGFAGASKPNYVVQTNDRIIQRCILMTTDPGDLVLDPTCGSGTTAYVAEQWGRRWITVDTSRIALNIAKQRLMTAVFPYYKLYDEEGKDIRQGFVYKTVPHITLKSLANDEPPEEETLYDQPLEEKKVLRVAGPFTVETLQNFEPLPPEDMDDTGKRESGAGSFEERIFEHLKSAGVKNGIRNEQAVFTRVDPLADTYLHAEGFYTGSEGEKKAYFHIGPQFGTVSKLAVNEAVKACRSRGDADWLIILGFSFESTITNKNVTTSMGAFEVTKVRMHDDLMQEGLLKRDKKAASFVTIGEPDIGLEKIADGKVLVEIRGLDIYDPIKDEVKSRNVEDIAYWMADTDYDGSNFVVRQVFFCGGGRDEFTKWRKGLENLAQEKTKKNAEMTLKIEIDDEAFDRLYGFKSHPFTIEAGRKVAVRVISQFGEESTKVLTVE